MPIHPYMGQKGMSWTLFWILHGTIIAVAIIALILDQVGVLDKIPNFVK